LKIKDKSKKIKVEKNPYFRDCKTAKYLSPDGRAERQKLPGGQF